MEYTNLGNTDIQISKLCVGCMSFGKAGTLHDWTLDEAATGEVVKHALSLGINFFDTANGYSAGTSEEYLGRALKKRGVQAAGALEKECLCCGQGLNLVNELNRMLPGSCGCPFNAQKEQGCESQRNLPPAFKLLKNETA